MGTLPLMNAVLNTPHAETLQDAVLVAGPAGLEAPMDAPSANLPLKRIGVRLADGSAAPLGRCTYRNRHIGVAETAPPLGDLPRLSGTSIFGGVVGPQFGHMVTQSLGRIWMADQAPEARLVFLAANLGFAELPGYFIDLLRSFGVRNPVELVTAPVVCDRLLIGPDLCNLEHRPCVSPAFHAWRAQHKAALPKDKLIDLYVSRSGLSLDHGQFLQETVLEAALEANGYTLFRPEQASIAVQIDTYLRARRVIFADGSAAHLWSCFARPDALATVLLRRPVDRHFAAWFRYADCPLPSYLDFGLADIFRRGEGPRRSVGVLDLQGVWRALRESGFHEDTHDIGSDRTEIAAWLSGLEGHKGRLPDPPFPLDPRSQALIALRTRIHLRESALPGQPGAATT